MTKLLRKLFIKDYQKINNPNIRTKHGLLASIVGIISNLLLFGFKLATGLITKSLSIMSDAINNLSDTSSGVVNLIGFKMSNKPADKKHPYGHQRIEYIAGLIVSFVIIALAIVLAYNSIEKLAYKTNDTTYSYLTFIVLGVAIFIKLWQGYFYSKIGKIIDSVSLKAASQDSFNDVLSTVIVLVGALLQYLLSSFVPSSKPYLYLIDGIMGLIVALIIVISGVKLIVEASNPLIGVSPDSEFVNKIVKDIKSYAGVLGVHDLVVHSYGPTTTFMTIHVEVDCRADILESHELIDLIENEISHKYSISLTIHMDPLDTKSPEIVTLNKMIQEEIKNYTHMDISFHDLRVVPGKKRTNVLFDIEIPFDINFKVDDLVKEIKKVISSYDKKYQTIIKVDRVY